jgi:hypothetical protein
LKLHGALIAFLAWSLATCPSALAVGWQRMTLPAVDHLPSGVLSGVSCVAADNCVAVGGDILERGTAGRWSLQKPILPAGPYTSFTDVSCVSMSACMLVGSAARPLGPQQINANTQGAPTYGFAESWNGRRWSVKWPPGAGAPGSDLEGVSCSSSTACTAVGISGPLVGGVPLVVRWNGKRWAQQRTPRVPVSGQNPSAELRAVACPTDAFCIAVGVASSGSGLERRIAEAWNGRRWRSLAAPTRIHSDPVILDGVSCFSRTDCTAVGSVYRLGNGAGGAVVMHWNGSRWRVRRVPQPPSTPTRFNARSVLDDVSCAGPGSCTAVGQVWHGTGWHPFVERWNGRSWAIAGGPTAPQAVGLASVSCPATRSCTAVGSRRTPNGMATFGERLRGGRWSIDRTADVRSSRSSALDGVACPAVDACIAVGSAVRTGVSDPLPLIDRLTGRTWTSEAPASLPAGATGALSAITCVSTNWCMSVGYVMRRDPADPIRYSRTPLAQLWDAGHWRTLAVPATSSEAVLNGVACVSRTRCFAVGQVDSAPLIETWDGTNWTTQPLSSIAGPSTAALFGISCPGSLTCVAVGQDLTQSASGVPLIEMWDGAGWASSPGPEPFGASLHGVSCASPSSCVAVGATTAETGWAEAWNGADWVPASPGGLGGIMDSVACTASTACAAVGATSAPGFGFISAPVTEQWTGTDWLGQSLPQVVAGYSSSLSAVACAGSTPDCVAVGSSVGPGYTDPLAEQSG